MKRNQIQVARGHSHQFKNLSYSCTLHVCDASASAWTSSVLPSENILLSQSIFGKITRLFFIIHAQPTGR